MNDRQESQSFRKLPRRQKVAVISLSFVAIGIIAVWFWQFNTRINSPFRASDVEIAQAKKIAAEKAAKEAAEKTKDSDKDGLTDVDETNIYGTSPYLEDTDGDGVSDFEEVRLGTNPLCDERNGASCVSVEPSAATSTASETATTTEPQSGIDQDLLITALSGKGNADTMRQILLQGGAEAEKVNALSDAELMTMYQEILKSQNLNSNTATTTATSTNQ